MELIGKIDHYAGGSEVVFSFKQYDNKASSEETGEIYHWESINLPFEVYKKFKNAKVKITIEKV